MKDKIQKFFQSPFILATASAILLRLSFPKFNLWFLSWVAFVPLLYALAQKQRPLKTFFISLLCGSSFFVMTIFWLVHVTVAGMFVLSFYLSFYFVVFAFVFCYAQEKFNFWQRLSFLPAFWVLLEFARSHLLTGFPWALLGYSQVPNLLAIQAADLFGVYGISFIVMFINIYIFELSKNKENMRSLTDRRLFLPLFIIVLWLTYGLYRLTENPQKKCPVKMTVVQGNIAQEIKWVSNFQDQIFNKYRLLTELVHLKEEPNLIIWPETSFPDYLEFDKNDKPLRDLAGQLKTSLLVGSIRFQDQRYFNSALLFSSAGTLAGVYDKLHLVPFGEYIPLRRFLPGVERILPIEDFTSGTNFEIFSVPAPNCGIIKFGVLICFEDTLNSLAREFVRRGADVLINMTNDGWFGDTACPYQHLQASVLRAVENRVFVLRAANTGVSCFIDDCGRVIVRVHDSLGKETFVTGYGSGLVYKTARSSLYTKIGDVFVFLCSVYAGLMFLGMLLARFPKTQTIKIKT